MRLMHADYLAELHVWKGCRGGPSHACIVPSIRVVLFGVWGMENGGASCVVCKQEQASLPACAHHCLSHHALKCAVPRATPRYNDRVARNEGRILGFVNEARGSRITGYTRSMKRMVEKVMLWGVPARTTTPAPCQACDVGMARATCSLCRQLGQRARASADKPAHSASRSCELESACHGAACQCLGARSACASAPWQPEPCTLGTAQEHIPKPCGEDLLAEVRAWVDAPETWDRERVLIAEIGYVPEHTAGVRASCRPCLPLLTPPRMADDLCWRLLCTVCSVAISEDAAGCWHLKCLECSGAMPAESLDHLGCAHAYSFFALPGAVCGLFMPGRHVPVLEHPIALWA